MTLVVLTPRGDIACEHISHAMPPPAVAIVPVQVNGIIKRYVAVCAEHTDYGGRTESMEHRVIDLTRRR